MALLILNLTRSFEFEEAFFNKSWTKDKTCVTSHRYRFPPISREDTFPCELCFWATGDWQLRGEVSPLMSCYYSRREIYPTSMFTAYFLGDFIVIIKKIRNIVFQQKKIGINLRKTMVSYLVRISEESPTNLRRDSVKNVTLPQDGTVYVGQCKNRKQCP